MDTKYKTVGAHGAYAMSEDWDKYGVTVPPELSEEIERPLQYGDSRSKRIRELIRLGLAAEEVMIEKEYYHPLIEEREERLKAALREHIRDINR